MASGNVDTSITAHNGVVTYGIHAGGNITAGDLTAQAIGAVTASGSIQRNITATTGDIGEVIADGAIQGDVTASDGDIGLVIAGLTANVNGVSGIDGDITAGGDIGTILTYGANLVDTKYIPRNGHACSGTTPTRQALPNDIGHFDGDITAGGTIGSVQLVGNLSGNITAADFTGYEANGGTVVDVWVLGDLDGTISSGDDLTVALWGAAINQAYKWSIASVGGGLLGNAATQGASHLGFQMNAEDEVGLYVIAAQKNSIFRIYDSPDLGGANGGDVFASAFQRIIGSDLVSVGYCWNAAGYWEIYVNGTGKQST